MIAVRFFPLQPEMTCPPLYTDTIHCHMYVSVDMVHSQWSCYSFGSDCLNHTKTYTISFGALIFVWIGKPAGAKMTFHPDGLKIFFEDPSITFRAATLLSLAGLLGWTVLQKSHICVVSVNMINLKRAAREPCDALSSFPL